MTRLHQSREPNRYRKRGMFFDVPMGVKDIQALSLRMLSFDSQDLSLNLISQMTSLTNRISLPSARNLFDRLRKNYRIQLKPNLISAIQSIISNQLSNDIEIYTSESCDFETSFCWAFAISTMVRHSLNYFLWRLARERPRRFDNEIIVEAIQYLNSCGFHRRLRTGFTSNIISSEFTSVYSSK